CFRHDIPHTQRPNPAVHEDDADSAYFDDGDDPDFGSDDEETSNNATKSKRYNGPCKAYVDAMDKALRTTDKVGSGKTEVYRKIREGIIHFPAPEGAVSSYRNLVVHGILPSPEDHFAPDIIVWIPHEIFPRIRIVCHHCRHTSGISPKGWPDAPRWIYGFHKKYLLFTRKYACKNTQCNKIFLGTDRGFLDCLPPAMKQLFPCVLTHRAGITMDLARTLFDFVSQGLGPGKIHYLVRSNYMHAHTKKHSAFLSTIKMLLDAQNGKSLNLKGTVIDETFDVTFPSYKSERFGGGHPSGKYIQKVVCNLVEQIRPYLDGEMQRRGGTILSADHSFK
ncbi:hypothetical protein HDV05_001657, partial [Chytridiales sp. JEL 0842]